ncbi:Butyrate--CoA ligase [Candidatus Terasakiella magnetica]|uniref:Butyrate--CoA ligase n=1 Tax=Candidatus Terasakiella magnetica TaxID=1867952 RepID=A0A1C3RK29_9PROT|nr:AMP-binding protein [Candidatus Terasakiella magnetica]SCA57626.1 Butyrate--CoA ligase [Candidatus Terasakiella magnetica]
MSDVYQAMRDGFDLEIPADYNFAFDLVEKRAKETPEKVAYIAVSRDCETVEEHTYAHLNAKANRFANGLKKLGCKKGDFACVVIARLPAWYEVLVGSMKVGVVSMPGTNLLTAHDLEYRINRAGAKLAIVTAEHASKIEEIKEKCPTLEHLIIIGGEREGWVNFETLCAENSDELERAECEPTGADDLMLIYFTSGTTSLPKMVPRDYSYGLAHKITGQYWMGLKDGDIHWTLTDTGWAKAAWGMLFPPMLMGATILLYDGDPKFDADIHLKLIERFGVNCFCAPPTVYRVFAQMDLSPYKLESLNHCIGAGEPLNPEVMRTWKEATGCDVYDGYGQTETVNIVANYKGMEVRPGSMGKPVPGLTVDVVDEDGEIVEIDTVGHIAVKMTQQHPLGLFTGYFKDEAANAKCFKNGWYYTGDTATRDKDGYIWFVGRSDDIIGSAGYRISPFEVESALIEHPAIAESAVVGKPDPVRGEIVKAYVTLSAGYEGSKTLEKEIQDFVKNLTAPYKYPREIEFREALPKTISGKIRRVELRDEAKAEG